MDALSVLHLVSPDYADLSQLQVYLRILSCISSYLSHRLRDDPCVSWIRIVCLFFYLPDQNLTDSRVDAPIASHSFLLPQWGGVVIFNPVSDVKDHFQLSMADLSPAFSTFQDQLSTLLGVPLLPPGIAQSKDTKEVVISDWQLDALIRRRARESAEGSRETLESIVKLVAQIDNMPVGRDVRGDVQNSLNALEKVSIFPRGTCCMSDVRHVGVHQRLVVATPRIAAFKSGPYISLSGLLQPWDARVVIFSGRA